MLADMWFLHMGPIDQVPVPTPYFGHIGGNRNERHVWWQSEAILVPQGTDSTRVGPHSVGLIRPPGRVEAACWAANSHLREQEYQTMSQADFCGVNTRSSDLVQVLKKKKNLEKMTRSDGVLK